MFKFFKRLMKAFEEARLNEAEDLESIRELNYRLEQIFERRARGTLAPTGDPFVPGSPSSQATKAWRSAVYSSKSDFR
jgi:hypothetical protein